MHFLHLGKLSGQKSNLENLPSAFCAFGKVSAVQKSHLVKFRACRTFDLGEIFQVRKHRTWGGAWPGPVLRRRTGYGSGADIRPRPRPSAGELATGRGLTFGPVGQHHDLAN